MMKSSYWQERFLKEEQRRNKDARVYLSIIEKQYDKALRNIEKDINDWYSRVAKNNEISLRDAKMLLSKNELKEFHWTIEEYIQKGKENAVSQEWMKQLENASAKVHISKLEALKVQIQNEIEGLYGERLKGMEDYLERVYGDTYYRSAFSVQQGLGIGWSLASLDTNRINQIIHKPWAVDGKNFSERLWEDKTKLINTLHTGLIQNIIRGSAPDNLIRQIAKEFGVKKSVAGRLVMTESAAYSSKAQEQCFKDLDVEKYEIIATLDASTSAICREMDGKVFLMKDYLVGVTANPFHPNCRTVTAPYFEDDTNSMRAMRTAGGKTEYVPANMKYDEWYKKYVMNGSEKLTLDEERAIMKYKSPSMYVLNDKLRKGIELDKEEKEWVKNLDSALKKMPYYKGEVIRTLTIKDAKELKDFIWDCVPGKKIFNFKTYTSTSKGEIYDDSMPIRFIISNSTKGRDISKFGLNEDEILYERNCKFKVLNVKYTQDNKFYIYLEELNE